jgi:hypothetical protein
VQKLLTVEAAESAETQPRWLGVLGELRGEGLVASAASMNGKD